MAGNKPVTGRLLHDDVDDVLTVEVARMAQEGLCAIIMIFIEVLEFPIPPVIVAARRSVNYGPAGEGPGGLPDVRLGVVGMSVHTHAQAEQFEQLPPPVFIDRMRVAVAVVQPVDHGRVPGQRDQQSAVVAQCVLAEHVDLSDELVPVVDLRLACSEDVVPEEHHLLLQWPLGVQHSMKPHDHPHARGGDGLPERGEVAQKLVPVISTTLHDSLLARLDRLEMVQALAQLGARLGREFPYALLQAVSPRDEGYA